VRARSARPLLVDREVTEIVATRFDALAAVRAVVTWRSSPLSPPKTRSGGPPRLCGCGHAARAGRRAFERRLRDGSRLWAVMGAAAPTGLLVIQKPRRIGATLESWCGPDHLPRDRHVPRPVHRRPRQRARVGPVTQGPAPSCGAGRRGHGLRVVVLHEIDDVAPPSEWSTKLSLAEDADDSARLVRVAARSLARDWW